MATQIFLEFSPLFGENFTNIFQMGWNHQLDEQQLRCGVARAAQLCSLPASLLRGSDPGIPEIMQLRFSLTRPSTATDHQTIQVPKMEVLTCISCMDTAYVSENPPPKWPYKVQYLHFRYLKFLVNRGLVDLVESVSKCHVTVFAVYSRLFILYTYILYTVFVSRKYSI